MDKVVVINFGSQYTHLITTRIRELGVYSEIIQFDEANKVLHDDKVRAVILSGGPKSVLDLDSPKVTRELLENLITKKIKILGICYGHQLIAHLFDGNIEKGVGEYGPVRFRVIRKSKLFKGLPREFTVWMSHSDHVTKVPKGFKVIGKTDNCEIAAMESEDEMIFGVQFHPEVIHTQFGKEILNNFLKLARVKREWNLKNVAERIIKEIKETVKNGKVVLAASGGVDSTVTAALIKKAIGKDNLFLVFINTGFLRDGEPEEVLNNLKKMNFNVFYVDASEKFLKALKGISDPEEKRRIFAKIYAETLKEAIKELERRHGRIDFFAQGTIYPDKIESGVAQKMADRIKSHHNVVSPIPEGKKLLEPIASLYKYEVREIGKILGVPDNILKRKPFPGPGLLIRILGAVDEKKLQICRKVHKIVEEEAKKLKEYDELWQIFPVLLDSKSVGIKGDKRAYGYVVVIRAVKSIDGMTADIAELSWKWLREIATKITGEVPEVTRVVFDVTTKPPATIELE